MKKLALILWRFSKADLRILWYALSHPDRPTWLRPAAVLMLVYAISPLNFAIPALGLVDDLVIVPMVLHFLMTLLPQHIRNGATGTIVR